MRTACQRTGRAPWLCALPLSALAACVQMGNTAGPVIADDADDGGPATDSGPAIPADTGPAQDAGRPMDTGAPADVASDAAPEGDGPADESALVQCTSGMVVCEGGCSNLQTDTANCGSCGVACITPHATPACHSGTCAIGSCAAGWADCDRNAHTGCESYIATDINNCGACGSTCSPGMACVGGECTSQNLAVRVPTGTYAMGGDMTAYNDMPGQPAITVNGFTIDAFEVTVGRFRRFWAAGHPAPMTDPMVYPGGTMPWGGHVTEPDTTMMTDCNWSETPGALETHPINCVDWYTAQAFCAWDGGRLPTEAEWEYVARGSTMGNSMPGRNYAWGDTDPTATCDIAEWNECTGDDNVATRRIGSFAPTFGIYDLAGNVWEWTADWYAAGNDTTCWNGMTRSNPVCGNTASGFRVLRGGADYSFQVAYLRGATRIWNVTTYHDNDTGFRCVRPTVSAM